MNATMYVGLAVTSLEAPSNYLAFPQLAQMQVSVGAVPSPDVRQPRRPVEYVLWRYAGTRPVVAVAAEQGAWRRIAEAPIPPAGGMAAAWTGRQLVVWGGGPTSAIGSAAVG